MRSERHGHLGYSAVFLKSREEPFQKTLTRFRRGFKRRTAAPRAPSLRLAAAAGVAPALAAALLKATAFGSDVQPLRLQTTSQPVLYAHSSKHLSWAQLSGMMHSTSSAVSQTSSPSWLGLGLGLG